MRTNENEPVVSEIVERIDCMSLAIELAAARMGALGLAGVEAWLVDRFALLRRKNTPAGVAPILALPLPKA